MHAACHTPMMPKYKNQHNSIYTSFKIHIILESLFFKPSYTVSSQ